MRRGVPQAPSRKRKLGGRDKGGLAVSAVNSSFLKHSLPYVWAILTLREMVRSGSRPGQVRAADLMSPLWGGERRRGFRKVLENIKQQLRRARSGETSLDDCFIQGARASLPELRVWCQTPGFEAQPLSPVQ